MNHHFRTDVAKVIYWGEQSPGGEGRSAFECCYNSSPEAQLNIPSGLGGKLAADAAAAARTIVSYFNDEGSSREWPMGGR